MEKAQYLDEAFSKISKEMLEIFKKKYKDYGKGNILDSKEMGIAYRVNDKVRRLQNLLPKEENPENETINDTWMDIGVYAVIAILYRRGQFQELEMKD